MCMMLRGEVGRGGGGGGVTYTVEEMSMVMLVGRSTRYYRSIFGPKPAVL